MQLAHEEGTHVSTPLARTGWTWWCVPSEARREQAVQLFAGTLGPPALEPCGTEGKAGLKLPIGEPRQRDMGTQWEPGARPSREPAFRGHPAVVQVPAMRSRLRETRPS